MGVGDLNKKNLIFAQWPQWWPDNPISSQWLKQCILALITAIMTATHDEQKKEVYIICRLQIVTKLFGQGYIMVISLYYHISMSDWFDAPNYVAWQFDKG